MRDPARVLRARPFTLVVCVSCQSATDQVLDELRRAVRDCPHGVLISTGCLRKVLDCAGRRGLHAVVQPCTADRSPAGAAVRLGPLTTEADAAAVGAWLRAGMPDDGTLPIRLRAAPGPQHVAHLNWGRTV
ncbi:hypothetical protein ABZ890_47105 [Streptomyces sp. NPDC046984]|uniref:hypothetical protein n=1 Tax=Streptomyces sp. NPDC046984 TaxID=3155138 RepID=UPI0033DDC564